MGPGCMVASIPPSVFMAVCHRLGLCCQKPCLSQDLGFPPIVLEGADVRYLSRAKASGNKWALKSDLVSDTVVVRHREQVAKHCWHCQACCPPSPTSCPTASKSPLWGLINDGCTTLEFTWSSGCSQMHNPNIFFLSNSAL